MAGHSKWANIQHRKGRQDKIRGKALSRCAREILVAAKQGGGDPGQNPRLRLAIDKAKAANMTKDKIKAAIDKATGEGGEASNLEEVRYEGYGTGGVGLIIDCITDNRNRTAGEVRHLLSKSGGNLGTSGSVSYLFDRHGIILLDAIADEDKIFELALEAGASDVVSEADQLVIITAPEQFIAVCHVLDQANIKINDANIREIPSNYINLDQNASAKMSKLLEALEDLDDVQAVYHNGDFSEV